MIISPTEPNEEGFNYKGQKVIFYGVPEFYYPSFTNMRKEAEDNLEVGKEYTIEKCEVYGSWSAVWIKGIPDYYFNASFFKKQSDNKPIMNLLRRHGK